MLLKEMFSPIGGPDEDQDQREVDWIGDLKFFMDSDEKMLENYFFPAVERHRDHFGNPNAWKLYVRPIRECLKCYLEQYEIEDSDKKFTDDALQELAEKICKEQEKFIEEGDYDAD
jgi:hypothetical protein